MDNIDLFDKYIKGELSEKERHEFDTRLKDDKSFADDFKVYSATVIGICKEAEQDNKDFEVAMKQISKKQLCEIIGKKEDNKTEFQIAASKVAEFPRAAASKVSEFPRAAASKVSEFTNAASKVAEVPIVASKVGNTIKPNFFRTWMWQAACWAVIIGGAAIWIVRANTNARYAVDNAIYASAYVYEGPVRGGFSIPDLNTLSDAQLEEFLPKMIEAFDESNHIRGGEVDEDLFENGYPLAMAYLRLHERDKAKEILNEMINKLSAHDEYTEEVSKLKSILDILK